jgi:hypothetical protein
LILPSTCTKIFQVFSCQDVDPEDDVSGDDEYMTIDYSVSCSSSKYHFGFAWAIASILVYPIGIPAYYFYVLYTNKEAIQSRDDVISDADSERGGLDDSAKGLVSIRLLFDAYRPCYWYWEVVETFRRLMLTGVLVLIAQGSAVQIIVGICLSTFFLKLYDSYSPYADTAVRTVEAISQRQICVVFFLALLVKADFESVNGTALVVCLVLAVFMNIIVLFVTFVTWRCHVSVVDWQLQTITTIERESEMSVALRKSNYGQSSFSFAGHLSAAEGHLGGAMGCDGVGSEADFKQSTCKDNFEMDSHNPLSGVAEVVMGDAVASPLSHTIEDDDVDAAV